jgi:hypothetical protein
MTISYRGGKYEEGTGEGQILIGCTTSESREELRDLLSNASDSVKMAIHWLCFGHMQEIFSLKDTTLGDFFVDGFIKDKHAYVYRANAACARLNQRKELCGDMVPSKLADGKITKFSYTLWYHLHAYMPYTFQVSLDDAMAARAQVVADTQEGKLEDVSWLVSL